MFDDDEMELNNSVVSGVGQKEKKSLETVQKFCHMLQEMMTPSFRHCHLAGFMKLSISRQSLRITSCGDVDGAIRAHHRT